MFEELKFDSYYDSEDKTMLINYLNPDIINVE